MQQEENLEIVCRAATYFDTTPSSPAEGFKTARSALLALCDLLEQIADSIPGNVDRVICSALTKELTPFICKIHRFEEETLYPLTLTKTPRDDFERRDATIERLKHEHLEDRCFAEELTEALRELSQKPAPENPDAIGYMLRGFFEAMRRHVAFEVEHLRPYVH